jgi:hypothetical protein
MEDLNLNEAYRFLLEIVPKCGRVSDRQDFELLAIDLMIDFYWKTDCS